MSIYVIKFLNVSGDKLFKYSKNVQLKRKDNRINVLFYSL